MKYTNKQMIDIEESAKKRKKSLVHITDKSKFSTEDKIKFGLCKHFVQFMVEKRLTTKAFSELTKIPESRISEITNYKFQKFTVSKLLKYLDIMAAQNSQFKEYLKLLGSVAEMPVSSVSKTRSLINEVEKAYHP